MPFIAFESGQLSASTKEQLIEVLTEVSSQITGIPQDMFIISIREQPDQNIALGGKTVAKLKSSR